MITPGKRHLAIDETMNKKENTSTQDGAQRALSSYLSPLATFALSFGYAVGGGAFVMPGKLFLPGAGPLGTVIAVFIGALVMMIIA